MCSEFGRYSLIYRSQFGLKSSASLKIMIILLVLINWKKNQNISLWFFQITEKQNSVRWLGSCQMFIWLICICFSLDNTVGGSFGNTFQGFNYTLMYSLTFLGKCHFYYLPNKEKWVQLLLISRRSKQEAFQQTQSFTTTFPRSNQKTGALMD